MSELLGNKFCIDSLVKDVKDIHSTLSSVTSRIGPVNFKSWKFPDKSAAHINVEELIEMYEYDEDFQEENKLSHVMLLELVIDSKYADQTLAAGRAPSAVDSNTSLGIITKKYWNKMVQVYTTVQQDHSDLKSQKRRIIELQDFNQQLQKELLQYQQGVTSVPMSGTGSANKNSSSMPPPTPQIPHESIAKDNSNKSSQTFETAFVPCESCHRVQASFCSVGDAMSHLCKDQGLPSSLVKYRKQLKGIDWYTANDIARWSAEQNKDIDKINKHLTDLMNTIDPLKQELSETLNSCRALEKRVGECQREVDLEKETQKIQLTNHVAKVEKITADHEELRCQLEEERKSLKSNKVELEKRLRETRKELELSQSKYNELDEVKSQLMTDLEESKTNNAEVKRLENILSNLEQEMRSTKQDLVEAETRLSQEQAVNKSLNKRTESLQHKYDALLRRVDELDTENVDLQSELSSLSEEKEQLENTIAGNAAKGDSENENSKKLLLDLEGERSKLRKMVNDLEQNLASLESDMKSMKEREQLLVEYPDLNGPVNPDYQGTGDVATDMSNQVGANEIRIGLLDKQNKSLRKTLQKLEQKGQQISTTKLSTLPKYPQQLWNQTDSTVEVKSHNPSMALQENRGAGDEFTVNRPPDKTRGHSSSRNSGVDAYIKLKKAGLIKPTPKPTQGASASSSFCCPRCDKLYHSAADLDLHKSYCAK